MSTKYVDETCQQNSFRPNYVDKMSSTKYAVDLSAVDEVSIGKMSVDKVLSTKYLSTNDMQYILRLDQTFHLYFMMIIAQGYAERKNSERENKRRRGKSGEKKAKEKMSTRQIQKSE